MFFPATARHFAPDTVEIGVEAWVYESERRPGVTTAFRHYLRLDPDTLSPAEYEEFRRRVRLFLTDSEGGKLVPLAITTPLKEEPRSLALPVTPPSGRTSARFSIPAPEDPSAVWILFETRGGGKNFRGRALITPDEGVSIISDIDDTIRHTHVLDRREMLLNTFARPLAAVPGMAELYSRTQAADEASVRFHYVSGGPHQLWPMIEQFLQEHGFPPGSAHMRSIDWRAEVFGESAGSVGHKLAVIGMLMRDFPKRRFILVGDSGERDPEIYGQIARDFPGQIASIHIRNVTNERPEDPRYAEAFRGIAPEQWSLFSDPAALTFIPQSEVQAAVADRPPG